MIQTGPATRVLVAVEPTGSQGHQRTWPRSAAIRWAQADDRLHPDLPLGAAAPPSSCSPATAKVFGSTSPPGRMLLRHTNRYRKESMFYLAHRVAHAGHVYMSLIQTCRLWVVDPLAHLTRLQRNPDWDKAVSSHWLPSNHHMQPDAS